MLLFLTFIIYFKTPDLSLPNFLSYIYYYVVSVHKQNSFSLKLTRQLKGEAVLI